MGGHLFLGERSIHSVFALGKRNEDALSYALGYLLAVDPALCADFLKESGVLARRPIRKLHRIRYTVRLQQHDNVGRMDVVVEFGQQSVVIEAKIGAGQPSVGQLVKYSRSRALHKNKAIVALTRDPLDSKTRSETAAKLRERGIRLHELQWHHILEMVQRRLRDGTDTPEQELLARHFIRFFKEDYDMRYYDVEVFVQDVNLENEAIFENGWAYVNSSHAHGAPLYFAPYFTGGCAKPGVRRAARVLHVEPVDDLYERALVDRIRRYFVGLQEDARFADNWHKHWKQGLRMIIERAKRSRREGYLWGPSNLYFLSEPFDLLDAALKKPKNFRQIPHNFSRTIEQLRQGELTR